MPLKTEMELLATYILEGKDAHSNSDLEKHADWVDEFLPQYEGKITKDNVNDILNKEIGKVFVNVLKDAGVFKCDEEGRKYFMRFIESV